MRLGLIFSLTANLFYTLYHGILGVSNHSLWLIAMCAFYGILTVMRFTAMVCGHKKEYFSSDDINKAAIKLCGLLLIMLSFVLAAVNYLSLSQNIKLQHDKITMITIAAYTFGKITVTAVTSFKQHKHPSWILKTLRKITFAEAAASLLTLQRSMLASFGSIDRISFSLMNAITGAFTFLFVWILGLSMFINPIRREKKTWQNLNLSKQIKKFLKR